MSGLAHNPDPDPELSEEEADFFLKAIKEYFRSRDRKNPTSPKFLGNYILESIAGQGGFGIVYRAHDTIRKRTVAIKIPRSEFLGDEQCRRTLAREARAAALVRHPGVVEVFDIVEADGTSGIVSEFCEGTSLYEWLKKQAASVPTKSALYVMTRLCEALEYAHSQQVYHCDLKPANVLLIPKSPTEQELSALPLEAFDIKLTDFGLAQVKLEGFSSISHLSAGTPHYMPPEQINGEKNTPRAAIDIYSLGVMLHEMLVGRTPFDNTENLLGIYQQISNRSMPSARQQSRSIPRDLDRICLKAMAYTPEHRYSSVAALNQDLQSFAEEKAISWGFSDRLNRAKAWLGHTNRIAETAWFLIASNAIILLWILTTVIWLAHIERQFGREVSSIYMCYVLAVDHLSMILGAWQILRGRYVFFYPLFILATFNLIASFLGVIGVSYPHEDIYDNRVFRIILFTLLHCGFWLQMIVLLTGYCCVRKKNRHP